jgi:hypothetical protein
MEIVLSVGNAYVKNTGSSVDEMALGGGVNSAKAWCFGIDIRNDVVIPGREIVPEVALKS